MGKRIEFTELNVNFAIALPDSLSEVSVKASPELERPLNSRELPEVRSGDGIETGRAILELLVGKLGEKNAMATTKKREAQGKVFERVEDIPEFGYIVILDLPDTFARKETGWLKYMDQVQAALKEVIKGYTQGASVGKVDEESSHNHNKSAPAKLAKASPYKPNDPILAHYVQQNITAGNYEVMLGSPKGRDGLLFGIMADAGLSDQERHVLLKQLIEGAFAVGTERSSGGRSRSGGTQDRSGIGGILAGPKKLGQSE